MSVSRVLRLLQGYRIQDDFGIELGRKFGTGMTGLRTATARFFGFGVCLAMVDWGNQGVT